MEIGREAFQFMSELWVNNNKGWFDENRSRYENHLRKPLKSLAEALSKPLESLLPDYDGKWRISRINSDLRFHPGKAPYKEHIWISFGQRGGQADIFAAIGHNGWSVGAAVGGKKADDLRHWHKNLLNNQNSWRKYVDALSDLQIFTENSYKKPLYSDIPDDLTALIQARGIWLVRQAKSVFESSAFEDIFQGLCLILPAYLLMLSSPAELSERLMELTTNSDSPDESVRRVWRIFSS